MFRARFAASRGLSTALQRPSVVAGSSSSRKSAVALACATAATLALLSTASSPALTHHDEDHNLLKEMNQRLIRLENAIVSYDPFLATMRAVKQSHPGNLAAKWFSESYFNSLLPELKLRLYKVVRSGADNADSGMGCYAMYPDDYEVFAPFFAPVIKAYHKIEGEVRHVTSWDLGSLPAGTLPADGKLDLSKLGLSTTSMRVRVGRNLDKFPLPGAQTKEQRVQMENELVEAFEKLMKDDAYGGTYYSLTPGSKYEISKEKYDSLVKAHVMFKDMADDPYLASAGISNDWPYGRGAYQSKDGGFIVWVGEEDHLRIMAMKKGIYLNDVFDRLKTACDVVEQIAGKFAHSANYGYVTSCPTNLGTGMRASIHVKLPNLTAGNSDAKAKAICKPLGLSVRGTGGEHTPVVDGIVDISPSGRLCITEANIIAALYKGISLLLEAEKKEGGSKL